MIDLVISILLHGNISNEEGRVGVTANPKTGGITHVYKHSFANWVGIKKTDVILSCDGVKGVKKCIGPAYTYAHLKVLRKGEVVEYDVFRLPYREVYDRQHIWNIKGDESGQPEKTEKSEKGFQERIQADE